MKYFLCFHFLLLLIINTSLGANSPIDRDLAGKKFEHVGLVFINQTTACTVSIIKHGLLITAKHCFTSQGFYTGEDLSPELLEIYFIKNSDQYAQSSVIIDPQNITKVVLDSGNNDLAFITYDPLATEKLISLPQIELYSEIVQPGTSLTLVGSQPLQLHHNIYQPSNFQKIKTPYCHRVDQEGEILPIGRHQGYEGNLYGTNCPGWFGNSGGPFYIIREEKLILVGVLTHTFDLLENGNVDPMTLYRDQFGEKGESTNYSAVKDSLFLFNQ
jgi:hypothetical protein